GAPGGQGEQQGDADEAGRDVAVLDLEAERASDVGVDLAELVGVGGLVRLAVGVLGEGAQGLLVHRDAGGLAFDVDGAVGGAEGDGGDGDLGDAAGVDGLLDGASGGVVPVGQQDDVGGRRVVARLGVERL